MSKKHNDKEKKAKEAGGGHGAGDGGGAVVTEMDVPAQAGETDAQATVKPVEELERMQDRLLRLQADFDNFRKRTLRERAELFQRANEDLMLELLPVLDHLDMALTASAKEPGAGAVVAGVRLVRDQLLTVLGKFGLVAIDAEGAVFDPHRHEALAQVPSEDVPEHGVLMQSRRGFALGERVLRAAQVIVSSGPTKDASEAPGAAAGGEGS